MGEVVSRVRAGMLLVAAAELTDPNFEGTVVLLLDVNDEGALGVVLNRPSAVPVVDVLEPWAERCEEPEVLFQGGPVSTDGVLAVGRLADGARATEGFAAIEGLDGRLGLVDLDAAPEQMDEALAGLRIFAGYAGWGAQQLLDELNEGAWYVVPALVEDVFREDNTTLRRDVLRRQPGSLAWISTRPADANQN